MKETKTDTEEDTAARTENKTETGTKIGTRTEAGTAIKIETATGIRTEVRNQTPDFRHATSPTRAEAWDSAWTGLVPTIGAGAPQDTSKPTPDAAASAKKQVIFATKYLMCAAEWENAHHNQVTSIGADVNQVSRRSSSTGRQTVNQSKEIRAQHFRADPTEHARRIRASTTRAIVTRDMSKLRGTERTLVRYKKSLCQNLKITLKRTMKITNTLMRIMR